MKKQNYKFLVQTHKFGRATIKNIKAYNFDEAKEILFKSSRNFCLTYTLLIDCQEGDEFKKRVNPITNFDFNYESEFYKKYVDSL